MKKYLIIITIIIITALASAAETKVLYMTGYGGGNVWDNTSKFINNATSIGAIYGVTTGVETQSLAIKAQAANEYANHGANTDNKILIGHSQGGLRALYYANQWGSLNNVKAVFTVGSPIGGAPIVARGGTIDGYLNNLVNAVEALYLASEAVALKNSIQKYLLPFKNDMINTVGAQDMNPSGNFIQKDIHHNTTVSRYIEHGHYELYWQWSGFLSGNRIRWVVDWYEPVYVWNNVPLLSGNTALGAIYGGEKDIFKTTELSQVSDLQLSGVRMAAGYAALAHGAVKLVYRLNIFDQGPANHEQDMESAANWLFNKASREGIQGIMDDVLGSSKHDLLIPEDNAMMTTEIGTKWIDRDCQTSNYRQGDALHGSMSGMVLPNFVNKAEYDHEDIRKKLVIWINKSNQM